MTVMTWQLHSRRLHPSLAQLSGDNCSSSSPFWQKHGSTSSRPAPTSTRRRSSSAVQVQMRATSIAQQNIALRGEVPVVVLPNAVESSGVPELPQDSVRVPSSAAGAAKVAESPSTSFQLTPDTTQKKGGWGLPFRGWELPRSAQACILLNVGAALFGSNQVVIKLAEADIQPELLNMLRFGLAALCFAPAIAKGLKQQQLWKPSAELGFWLFGGYTAQALGLMQTTAARGAFTGTFTVLAVPVLVGLSGRSVSIKTWIAAAVALVGVGLLTNDAAAPNMGDAFCVLSAVLFGVHKWRTESVTAEYSDSTTELIALQLGVLAFMSGLASLPLLGGVLNSTPGDIWQGLVDLPWPALAYMGVATTAFTLWIEMHALKDVSAPLAALIYTAEPLWGGLFAYMVLAERWGPMGWVGAGLIVSASLASQLKGSSPKTAEVSVVASESPSPDDWVPQAAIPATCAAARTAGGHHSMRMSHPEVKPLGMTGPHHHHHHAASNLSHRPTGRRPPAEL